MCVLAMCMNCVRWGRMNNEWNWLLAYINRKSVIIAMRFTKHPVTHKVDIRTLCHHSSKCTTTTMERPATFSLHTKNETFQITTKHTMYTLNRWLCDQMKISSSIWRMKLGKNREFHQNMLWNNFFWNFINCESQMFVYERIAFS